MNWWGLKYTLSLKPCKCAPICIAAQLVQFVYTAVILVPVMAWNGCHWNLLVGHHLFFTPPNMRCNSIAVYKVTKQYEDWFFIQCIYIYLHFALQKICTCTGSVDKRISLLLIVTKQLSRITCCVTSHNFCTLVFDKMLKSVNGSLKQCLIQKLHWLLHAQLIYSNLSANFLHRNSSLQVYISFLTL